VFDDALEHRILPKSMTRPVLTKKQYIEYWKGVMALFAKFEVSTGGLISRRVVVDLFADQDT
jgi:hypothetical protein